MLIGSEVLFFSLSFFKRGENLGINSSNICIFTRCQPEFYESWGLVYCLKIYLFYLGRKKAYFRVHLLSEQATYSKRWSPLISRDCQAKGLPIQNCSNTQIQLVSFVRSFAMKYQSRQGFGLKGQLLTSAQTKYAAANQLFKMQLLSMLQFGSPSFEKFVWRACECVRINSNPPVPSSAVRIACCHANLPSRCWRSELRSSCLHSQCIRFLMVRK